MLAQTGMKPIRLSTLLAIAAAFSLLAHPARAQVSIQFEGIAAPGGVSNPATPLIDSGYILTAAQSSNSIFSATFPGVNHDGNATDYLGFAASNVITLATATDDPFSFVSLDAATLNSGGTTFTLNLVGFLGGLQTASQSLTVTSTWQTFTLSGFENVDSVTITPVGADASGVGIDNVTTDVVPEPSTIYLFIAAAAVVATVRWRRLVA